MYYKIYFLDYLTEIVGVFDLSQYKSEICKKKTIK